ncbi:hypothetical protein GAMM_350010 [Gammaproteobacteria bacterium]
MAQNNQTPDSEETYRKFLRLYERFVEDRATVSKQGEALTKIIEELKAESTLATEFKMQVRQGITGSVGKVLGEVNEQVKKSIQESVTAEINKSTKELKAVVDDSTKVLDEYLKDKKSRDVWIYCGVFFCGFIFMFTTYTAMVVRKYMPDTFFTSEQLRVYRYGTHFERILDKLSYKEQNRLIDISIGRIPPEENSIEGLRKKYPKMSNKELQKKFDEVNAVN